MGRLLCKKGEWMTQITAQLTYSAAAATTAAAAGAATAAVGAAILAGAAAAGGEAAAAISGPNRADHIRVNWVNDFD